MPVIAFMKMCTLLAAQMPFSTYPYGHGAPGVMSQSMSNQQPVLVILSLVISSGFNRLGGCRVWLIPCFSGSQLWLSKKDQSQTRTSTRKYRSRSLLRCWYIENNAVKEY